MSQGSGRTLGIPTTDDMQQCIRHSITSSVVTTVIYTAVRPMIVTDIVGRMTTAGTDGSAVTLSFYKCANLVAAASGKLLHAGTFNLKTTADTNIIMTLVTDPTVLTLNTGDSLAVALTGTATAAVGSCQIMLETL